MLMFWNFWLLFPKIGRNFIQFSGHTGPSVSDNLKFYSIGIKTKEVKRLGPISLNYFGVKLLTLFGKIDHFIKISNVSGNVMKRSSLQNRVCKFMSKKFYEIDPWTCDHCYVTFVENVCEM
jgi:hypothetical protein